MEMFSAVENWVNAMSPPDRAEMLEGLTKAGVRAGRNHDAKRHDGMGGMSATGGHSHSHGVPAQGGGSGGGGIGGYMAQGATKIPGYGYYQQAQGYVGQGQGYMQQAQHIFQGGQGVGGFVQNFAGQMGRRDVNERDGERDYAPPMGPPPRDEGWDLDEAKDPPVLRHHEHHGEGHHHHRRGSNGDGWEGHGRPEPPYPHSPPVQPYGQDYEEPLPGQQQSYGQPYYQGPPGQPPYTGQPPYGYDGRRY